MIEDPPYLAFGLHICKQGADGLCTPHGGKSIGCNRQNEVRLRRQTSGIRRRHWNAPDLPGRLSRQFAHQAAAVGHALSAPERFIAVEQLKSLTRFNQRLVDQYGIQSVLSLQHLGQTAGNINPKI